MARLPAARSGAPESSGFPSNVERSGGRRGGAGLRTAVLNISLVFTGLLVCGCDRAIRDHLASGDRLLGAGRVEAAMAEYQVALRQGGEQPEVLVRLAHGYAGLDRVDEAAEYYSRLLEQDSAYADQAVADFLAMARRAYEADDRARLARSLEQLEEIRTGAVPDELALPFARYYYELDEYAKALPLYLSALPAASDSLRLQMQFELGRSYKELGECGRALEHFQSFLERRSAGEQAADARWHAGQCAYELAQEDRMAGRPAEALERLELLIELGAPQATLDDAWFDRGELLFTLGRFDEAVESYEKVLELNPSRTGRLVRLAEDRIRAIRYRSST